MAWPGEERPSSARVLLLDLPLALALGVITWWSAAFARLAGRDWSEWRSGPGAHGPEAGELFRDQSTVLVLISSVLIIVTGLALRRIRPFVGFGLVVVGVATALLIEVPLGPIVLAPMLSVATLASRFDPRRWGPPAVSLIPMAGAALWPPDGRGLLDPGRVAGVFVVLLLLGLAATIAMVRRIRRLGLRRAYVDDLRQSAAEERLRIAREVHDLIGHSLSVINMQAGVALHVIDRRPEQAEESLRAIRQTSKDALAELRSTLAVFRDPGYSESTAPEPGLARVEELIAVMRQAGRAITLSTEGDLAGLPPTLDHTAYRIIQESLTNVARHAGPATAEVSLARQDGLLLITVSNDGPVLRSAGLVAGHGIAGMRERARAVGGTVRVEPRSSGGVEVRAVLPIRQDTP